MPSKYIPVFQGERRCPYCGGMWTPFRKSHRWHGCPQSVKRREFESGRVKGRLSPEEQKTRRRERDQERRESFKDVYVKVPKYKCRTCGTLSENYFHCPNCLGRLSSQYNLEILIVEGESRRLGQGRI
jgi:hypothetical protein